MFSSFWSQIGRVFQAVYGLSLALVVMLTATGVLLTDYNVPWYQRGRQLTLDRAVLARATLAQGIISTSTGQMNTSTAVSPPNGELTFKLGSAAALTGSAITINTRASDVAPGPTANYIVRAQGYDADGTVTQAWIKKNTANFASGSAAFVEGNWGVTAITIPADANHNTAAGRYDYLYAVAEQVFRFDYGFTDDQNNTYTSWSDVSLNHPPTPLRNLVVQYDLAADQVTIDLRGSNYEPRQANGYSVGNELVLRWEATAASFEPNIGAQYSANNVPPGIVFVTRNAAGAYVDNGPFTPGTDYRFTAWAYDSGKNYSLPIADILSIPPLPVLPTEGCTSSPAASGTEPPEITAGGTIMFTCTIPRTPESASLLPVDNKGRPKDLSSLSLTAFTNNGRLQESRSLYYLNGTYTIRLSQTAREVGQDSINVDPDFTFTFYLNSLPPLTSSNNILTNMVGGVHTLDFEIRVEAADGTVKTGKLSDYATTYALPAWRVLAAEPKQFSALQPDCPFSTFDLLSKDYQYPASFNWTNPNWEELKTRCDLPFTFLDGAAPTNVCGNSLTEIGEQCDDGNSVTNDACNNNCQRTICGDGQLQNNPKNSQNITEQCDPGGTLPTTTCDRQCQTLTPPPPVLPGNGVCSDGVVNWPNRDNIYEQCDHGGTPTATCDAQCQLINVPPPGGGGDPGSGDPGGGGPDDPSVPPTPCGTFVGGVWGTYCPDSTLPICDVASGLCRPAAICGNNILEAWDGEACDDGNLNNADACDATCQPTRCGDGIPQAPNGVVQNEQCDDGNAINTDLCNACQNTFCGDSIIQPIRGEICDDGNQANNDACHNCQLTFCGDNVVQAPNGTGLNEQCDPPGINCDIQCQNTAPPPPPPVCGDGVMNQPNEQCDLPGANCPAGQWCKADTCECLTLLTCNMTKPTGYIHPVGGLCLDDCPPGKTCNTTDCQCEDTPICGDGVINQPNEQCEPPGLVLANGDICNANCQVETPPPPPICGNGVVEAGEQCDDGNTAAGDGCDANCQTETTCGTSAPACNGPCPNADEICDNFSGEGCYCRKKLCGESDYPACGGECPPEAPPTGSGHIQYSTCETALTGSTCDCRPLTHVGRTSCAQYGIDGTTPLCRGPCLKDDGTGNLIEDTTQICAVKPNSLGVLQDGCDCRPKTQPDITAEVSDVYVACRNFRSSYTAWDGSTSEYHFGAGGCPVATDVCLDWESGNSSITRQAYCGSPPSDWIISDYVLPVVFDNVAHPYVYVKADTFTVRGRVTDSNMVSLTYADPNYNYTDITSLVDPTTKEFTHVITGLAATGTTGTKLSSVLFITEDAQANSRMSFLDFFYDTTLPTVTITSPTNGASVSSNTITISALLTDNDQQRWTDANSTTETNHHLIKAASIFVNNLFTDGHNFKTSAADGVHLSSTVNLNRGNNSIQVTTWDYAGNSNSATISVFSSF